MIILKYISTLVLIYIYMIYQVHSAITPGSTAGTGKEFRCTHENCTQAFTRKSHLTKHEHIHLGWIS